jgi:hypothetical protein
MWKLATDGLETTKTSLRLRRRLIQHIPGPRDSFDMQLIAFSWSELNDLMIGSEGGDIDTDAKWTLSPVNDVDQVRPSPTGWIKSTSFLRGGVGTTLKLTAIRQGAWTTRGQLRRFLSSNFWSTHVAE